MRTPSKASDAAICAAWAIGDCSWAYGAPAVIPVFLMLGAAVAFLVAEDHALSKVSTATWCIANALWCLHDTGQMEENWAGFPLVIAIVTSVIYAMHAATKPNSTP